MPNDTTKRNFCVNHTIVFEYVRSKEAVDTVAPLLPYTLAYSIGGINNMLIKWIESNMKVEDATFIAKLKFLCLMIFNNCFNMHAAILLYN